MKTRKVRGNSLGKLSFFRQFSRSLFLTTHRTLEGEANWVYRGLRLRHSVVISHPERILGSISIHFIGENCNFPLQFGNVKFGEKALWKSFVIKNQLKVLKLETFLRIIAKVLCALNKPTKFLIHFCRKRLESETKAIWDINRFLCFSISFGWNSRIFRGCCFVLIFQSLSRFTRGWNEKEKCSIGLREKNFL